jgi:GNAT superfamily N-acetyltransferase
LVRGAIVGDPRVEHAMPVDPSVREARAEDVAAMVALSSAKRTGYERVQPVFWRRADGADARQTAWFEHVLSHPGVIALVAEAGGSVEGFVIAQETRVPPVYDPGGRVFTIDDFCVASPDRWKTTGRALLEEVARRTRALGAAQLVVVCGVHDEKKRALLSAVGLAVASEWYVGRP